MDANNEHEAQLQRVTGLRWHSDNNPFGAIPKTHPQQFDSVYATEPMTFSGSLVPGCQKSAARAWKEHLDFLPVSSLVWTAVTLVAGVSRGLSLYFRSYKVHSPSSNLQLTVMDWFLECNMTSDSNTTHRLSEQEYKMAIRNLCGICCGK